MPWQSQASMEKYAFPDRWGSGCWQSLGETEILLVIGLVSHAVACMKDANLSADAHQLFAEQ